MNNPILRILREIGSFVLFLLHIGSHLPRMRKRFLEIVMQMKRIGVDSIWLISITSGFTGLVTLVQASYQTSDYIPTSLMGVMVAKSTMIELAPVLTALVLTGKVGASIAAEIGTMRVSEQIDALETMAIDPVDFVYMPRVIAGAVMVPLLTIYANIVGIFSAYILSVHLNNVNSFTFFNNMKNFFLPWDLWGGLIKGFFFGIIITTVGCYAGDHAHGGAEGVGRAATRAVVYSAILVLMMDFVVASVLYGA